MPFLAVLLVALLLSAIDACLTRAAYPHRLPSFALWLQTFGLWFAYALLALLPALLLVRLTKRGRDGTGEARRGAGVHFGAVLLFTTAAPVALHGVLDRYTSLGGDVSGLWQPRPWIEGAAVLLGLALIAFGLARLGRLLSARNVAWLAAALALALGGWATFSPARLEPQAAREAGEIGPSGRPNVLFLVWDTARAQSLSLYGYQRKTTPYLARLADQAYVFDNARSAAVFTLSSHVSMLTGVYPSHHGASLTRQYFDPRRTPTVTAFLRAHGYRTGAFVGTDVLRADTGVIDGFEHYSDATDPALTYTRGWGLLHDVQSVAAARIPALSFNGLPHWIQDYQRPAPPVLAEARAWIENGDPRPWFCFINLYDVHWPYLPARPFSDEWVASDYDGPIDGYLFRSDDYPAGYELDARDKRHLTELYDAEMAQLDDAVEAFLAAVDGDDVAMLLTSDHGEAFGEAGRYEHFDVIEPQVRVPLLVRPAGGVSPQYINTPTVGVDVAPTLIGLAGLHVESFGPRPDPSAEPDPERGEFLLAGRNLVHAGSRPPDRTRLVLVENRDKICADEFRIALYQGPWKVVRNGVGEQATWQLFNHEDDPYEERDLAAAEPEMLEGLSSALETFRGQWDPHDVVGPGAGDLDAMKTLGYIGTDEH